MSIFVSWFLMYSLCQQFSETAYFGVRHRNVVFEGNFTDTITKFSVHVLFCLYKNSMMNPVIAETFAGVRNVFFFCL